MPNHFNSCADAITPPMPKTGVGSASHVRRSLMVGLMLLLGLVVCLSGWMKFSAANANFSLWGDSTETVSSGTTPEPTHLYGILQNTPENAANNYAKGVKLAVIEVNWGRYNPSAGGYDTAYVASIKNRIQSFKNAGYSQFMLDLGIQYSPVWVQNIPNARFVNQYGTPYVEPDLGKNIVNAVFNAEVRVRIAAYMQRVFQDLGTNWHSVRLGGLWYGELHYPPAVFGQKKNCFWAFDPIAQGQSAQLPGGVAKCPVPGWKPGDASPSNQASQFANWYINSLDNYHDWQIAQVRRWYSGNICMLYPGFGIRAGELNAAIGANLAEGGSKILSTGEMQAGNDFARFISGISDPKVIVYTTHIDTPDNWTNESSTDPNQWSPLRWLGSLADSHPLRLRKWGENTGQAQLADLQRTFKRIRQANAMGVVWAFEPQLYSGQYATINQYSTEIQALP